MVKTINRLITRVLNRNFEIDENVPMGYLMNVITQRIAMLIRGKIKSLLLGKSGTKFFVGHKVKLKCKKKILMGQGVTINDNVEIDALSINGVVIGNNVTIGDNTIIRGSGSLSKIGVGVVVGNNTAIGYGSFLGAAGGIKIGNDVITGQNVRFHSENHNFRNTNIKIREQGVNNKGIVIGDDCWIGAGVVFLDGVSVGSGVVIGADTVVNKDIPNNAIAVGIPARVVSYRK